MTSEVVMTPDQMRAEADQLNASVREGNRALRDDARRAAHPAWVAALTEEADVAAAEWEGAKRRLPRLKADEDAALKARNKAAEERVRAEEEALALRRGELSRLEADLAPGDQVEDAALLVKTREGVVERVKVPLGEAEGKYAEARGKHAEWRAHVDELYREHAEADRVRDWAVRNPGNAPGRPGIALGVDGIGDMDPEARQLWGAYMMSLAATAQRESPAPRRPGEFEFLRDKTKFRTIRTGNQNLHIIPPAMRP
jgi:hypothetical protein